MLVTYFQLYDLCGPICFIPLQFGADLEIHSMTKYINGTMILSDVIGKSLLIKFKEIAMVNFGGILSLLMHG